MNKKLNKQKLTSLFFVGHIAIDEVLKENKPHRPNEQLGGSVSYCSLSLKKYSNKVKLSIISNFNDSDSYNSILQLFNHKNVNLDGIIHSDTNNTRFILDYYNHTRKLMLKSRCPDLKFKEIPENLLNMNPDAIILVPLCNEISYEYISKMAQKFPDAYYGIDLQGFIRDIDQEGHVSLVRNKDNINTILQIIDLLGNRLILKGSEEEMKIFSGKQDWTEVMDYFQQFNGIFIMTLGEKGSMITKKGEKILKIPAFKPKQVQDETGAGDVYLAIFLYEFINSPKTWQAIKKAGYLASAAASFEIEKKGVKGFAAKNKVLQRVNEKNYLNIY